MGRLVIDKEACRLFCLSLFQKQIFHRVDEEMGKGKAHCSQKQVPVKDRKCGGTHDRCILQGMDEDAFEAFILFLRHLLCLQIEISCRVAYAQYKQIFDDHSFSSRS